MIAEKLEALTALGTLNSRMKDYFDLWAVRRNASVESSPVGLEEEFALSQETSEQWNAFTRRARLVTAPTRFAELVFAVRDFAAPVLSSAA